jgi:hypothetical protein
MECMPQVQIERPKQACQILSEKREYIDNQLIRTQLRKECFRRKAFEGMISHEKINTRNKYIGKICLHAREDSVIKFPEQPVIGDQHDRERKARLFKKRCRKK